MSNVCSGKPRGVPDAEYNPHLGNPAMIYKPSSFIISLDFELHWGVRQLYPPDGGIYRPSLLGVRQAIPRMLDLFEEFAIAATWATVGFLFATSRQELESYYPTIRPTYDDPASSPYALPIGEDEEDDPLHFAPSLIEAIRRCPLQEIGTHTFSHYCCLEPGGTREAFKADLASAVAIAEKDGIRIRSIVFPLNQVRSDYLDLLAGAGITGYRDRGLGWINDYYYSRCGLSLVQQGCRAIDAYLNLNEPNVMGWDEVPQGNGLYRIPGGRFLRPYSPHLRHLDSLRLRRIARDIRTAAATGAIFHLWWHPHNVGIFVDENMQFLRRVLEVFAECRDRYGMQSLSMAMAADLASKLAQTPEIKPFQPIKA